MDAEGEIEEALNYVPTVDKDGNPLTKQVVSKAERNNIHVHYLLARRDPSDHIAYTANSLLGRLLRAADRHADREVIGGFTSKISTTLGANAALKSLSEKLTKGWQGLHKGNFFKDPEITFISDELETLLRHLSLSFAPGHGRGAN